MEDTHAGDSEGGNPRLLPFAVGCARVNTLVGQQQRVHRCCKGIPTFTSPPSPPPLPAHPSPLAALQVRKSIRLKYLTRIEAFIDSPGQQEYFELTFVQVGGRGRYLHIP